MSKDKALLELVHQIEKISCGEDQVADDDSEGLHYIYELIQEYYRRN